MFKIAILGRPNVGKSSLFNLLIKERKAITSNISGTTIDRLYARAEHLGKEFIVIDTGGLEVEKTTFKENIHEQASLAISEADLIIFLTDIKNGVTSDDEYIADILKKSQKDVLVCVNKVDNKNLLMSSYEFYSLGFEDVIPISIKHLIGVGDLLEYISKKIATPIKNKKEDIIKFTIIGRPNVGKSSLVNTILGEKRAIVSNIAGTTRDIIDTDFKRDKKKYKVIDTAGLLRPGKIKNEIERYSQERALLALQRSDVGILLLDASEDFINLDKNIAGYIKDANKAIVVAFNKWDLVEKKTNTQDDFSRLFYENFKFLSFANIVFISALENIKINDLFKEINSAYKNFTKKIKTSILNDILAKAITISPPKIFNMGIARFKYITQIGNMPPRFNLYVNNKKYVHFSYLRYLENEFRKYLDLKGTPIIFNLIQGDNY